MSVLDASQKEKYFYDRREWPICGIVLCVIIMPLLVLWFNLGFKLGFEAMGFVLGVSLYLIGRAGDVLHITVTDSRMTIMWGIFSIYQLISYDEIDSIIFRGISKFDYGEKREFGDASIELQFVVKLNNGDCYIIRSNHAEEVLAAIRKARPSIIIN